MINIVDIYTKDYNEINKEVSEIMGGNIIEIPGRKEFLEGKSEGIKQGILEGKTLGIIEIIEKAIAHGDLDEKTARKYLPKSYLKDKKNK